jgi:hypothetical protein
MPKHRKTRDSLHASNAAHFALDAMRESMRYILRPAVTRGNLRRAQAVAESFHRDYFAARQFHFSRVTISICAESTRLEQSGSITKTRSASLLYVTSAIRSRNGLPQQ